MQKLFGGITLLLAAIATSSVATEPGGVTTYPVDAEFEDVTFGIDSAILDRGLVVDSINRVGEMLNRTAVDVGAAAPIYIQADVYLFCSAVLSRKMMEADANNLAHCPYSVFVYERANAPGIIHVGYRHMPDGVMQEVQELLDAVAREAAGLD